MSGTTSRGDRRNRDGVPPAAAVQAGAFTAAQAVAAGLSPRQVDRRMASGAWQRVAGRGLTAEAPPHPVLRRAWAAALTWPHGVVGFETAAALYALPAPRIPAEPVVAVYRTTSRRCAGGLRSVRRPLGPHDVGDLAGLRVTVLSRTAADLLAARSWPDALDLYAWLTSRGRFDGSALSAAVRDRYDRWGNAQLRRLLEFTADGAVSVGERRAHEILQAAGITGWQAGVPILDGAVVVAVADILFPRQRLVIEIDGWRSHSSPEAFQRDRERQNRLIALGYRVLRFTWTDLTTRPEHVVRAVRAFL